VIIAVRRLDQGAPVDGSLQQRLELVALEGKSDGAEVIGHYPRLASESIGRPLLAPGPQSLANARLEAAFGIRAPTNEKVRAFLKNPPPGSKARPRSISAST
jgi:hypothetical protein